MMQRFNKLAASEINIGAALMMNDTFRGEAKSEKVA
jgi:hypothetical protein